MIKQLLIVLICFSGLASASDIINETNIVFMGDVETLGGSNYITPHMHYWDSWFALYNDGGVTYHVYMYDYAGNHPDKYLDAFIGTIEPDEMITLNSNASYRLYAIESISSKITVEKIEKRFNQYWLIGILFLIILIAGIIVIRKVVRR